MKSLCIISILAAGLDLAARGALADDIKVIANTSVGASDMTMDDLKGVFLATKTSFGESGHVEPVLEKSGPAHEAFRRRGRRLRSQDQGRHRLRQRQCRYRGVKTLTIK
jgi:hypothetical protein